MNSPLEVAYGSMATIKNMGYGGGLLHRCVHSAQCSGGTFC
jgi:dolichyl-phosphate-mannose-protein mannosyltransferase